MKADSGWVRIVYITGIVALVLGTIDPLEGSIVVATGSIFLSVAAFLSSDKYKKIFLAATILIIAGVSMLFYLSASGGFGDTSGLSWWWSALIVPYPVGWLISVVLIILKSLKRKRVKD